MRKGFRHIMALALAIMAFAAQPALADLVFDGTVAGGESISILAPFGGIIAETFVRVGDRIHAGELIAEIATTREFAPVEGTISGVFGKPGDQTEGITERYGAVLYIEPIHKYTVKGDTSKAYNASENKFIHIGETVYLSCTAKGEHTGFGVITKVEDSGYTIEVTGGEFSLEETVNVFRARDYSNESRIGRGTVSRTAVVPVKGSGSLLKLAVENGEYVERGQLLFETVEGVLDGLFAPGSEIRSESAGIVSAVDAGMGSKVEKNGKIITVFPDESVRIEIAVSESDLAYVKDGMKVRIEFNWDPDNIQGAQGEVTGISYNVKSAEGAPQYTAYVKFTPDDTVRLGMTVLVYAGEEPEAPAEEALDTPVED